MEEYSFLTANEFSTKSILEMEQDILNLLSMNLQIPTSLNFIELYIEMIQKVSELLEEDPIFWKIEGINHNQISTCLQRGYVKAKFLVEIALNDPNYPSICPSILASAALFLGISSENLEINDTVSKNMKAVIGQERRSYFEQAVSMLIAHWSDLKILEFGNTAECPLKKYISVFKLNMTIEKPPIINFFSIKWFDS